MASREELTRNNVRTGVFVTVSVLLAMASIIVITDATKWVLQSFRKYTVTFAVENGIADLKPGGNVRIGGLVMGEVIDVRPKLEEAAPFKIIEVLFELDSSVELYRDAQILIQSPLIGSDSWLEISSVGSGERLPEGEGVSGAIAPGMLTSLVGPKNAVLVDEVMANWADFSAFLKTEVPKDYTEKLVPTLENFRTTSEDVRTMVDQVKEQRWAQWLESIDQVTVKFNEALDEGKGLFTDARERLAVNQPGIDNIVANVETASVDVKEITQRVKDETVDKANALLARGQEAIDDAIAAITTLREDYEGWSLDFGETLANASLASQQLKLTTVELRRSPWKLLYRPTSDELEHELLYESARSFAMAASDLKAASNAVDRVVSKYGDRLSGDEASFQRIKKNLLDSMDNYERAQQQLFDVLVVE